MKKKLFTLLTLFVWCVAGASAQTYSQKIPSAADTYKSTGSVTWDDASTWTFDANTESSMGTRGTSYYVKWSTATTGTNASHTITISGHGLSGTVTKISINNYFGGSIGSDQVAAQIGTIGNYVDFGSPVSLIAKNSQGGTVTSDITGSATISSTDNIVLTFSNFKGTNGLYVNSVEVTLAEATFGAGKTMISFSSAGTGLDLSNLPDGLAAYKVSAADGDKVTLTPVTEAVKANTGLILTGTANTSYKIPSSKSTNNISGTNKLVATDGTSTVVNAAVLSGGEFHPLNGGSGVIAAGKAYLPYEKIEGGNPFVGGAHALEIVFGNETTAIKAVEAKKVENGVFYNLAGQQVAQPSKGLYIVNGKKVIIK